MHVFKKGKQKVKIQKPNAEWRSRIRRLPNNMRCYFMQCTKDCDRSTNVKSNASD